MKYHYKGTEQVKSSLNLVSSSSRTGLRLRVVGDFLRASEVSERFTVTLNLGVAWRITDVDRPGIAVGCSRGTAGVRDPNKQNCWDEIY